MNAVFRRLAPILGVATLCLPFASATLIPRVSFEELVDSSDLVVSGQITRTWAAWDTTHKHIWTHYELSVTSAQKGAPGRNVEFAEPGGSLDGVVMNVAGSVTYAVGDHVAVFLERMPNGYLRTTGWAQGKYRVDSAGHLRAESLLRQDAATAGTVTGASVRSLDGITVDEFSQRVRQRISRQRRAQ